MLRYKSIRTPRVESDSEMMTVGLGGSLADALRAATQRNVAMVGAGLSHLRKSRKYWGPLRIQDQRSSCPQCGGSGETEQSTAQLIS